MRIAVWAEHIEGFLRVGTLELDAKGRESFVYDKDYLNSSNSVPIYPPLPLQERSFGTQATRASFASLGPEGRVGHDLRVALRAGREAVVPVLARLNHETVGALAFTAEDEIPNLMTQGKAKKLDHGFIENFARNPEKVSFDTLLESRLSLNGAVAKVGVIQRKGSWYLPQGFEPTTHILKAGSTTFPQQMLNEALCMLCARECGFDDAPETSLIVLDNLDPILVSRRFDRLELPGRPAELPTTMRLHQADFCQLAEIAIDSLKYVPSDELVDNYNSIVARVIATEANERYGDRSYAFDIQVFNYLIGNCDNHLKNLSMTWTPDWSSKSLSPIYDITCTTMYPDLTREMGLGIGEHRALDAVTPQDFVLFAQQMGIGLAQAKQSMEELARSVGSSIMESAHRLETEHGVKSEEYAERIRRDGVARCEVVLKACQ